MELKCTKTWTQKKNSTTQIPALGSIFTGYDLNFFEIGSRVAQASLHRAS